MLGSNESYSLKDTVRRHPSLLVDQCLSVPGDSGEEGGLQIAAISGVCVVSVTNSSSGGAPPLIGQLVWNVGTPHNKLINPGSQTNFITLPTNGVDPISV